MNVLAPFEITLAHAGNNYQAFVTPIDGCEVVQFEILLNGKKFLINWENNIENEVPTLLPQYFSPDVESFQGNDVLYKLMLTEMLEVLCDRFC
ncbi:hypothetical protein C3K47_11950 [Solitalea longa]|uniref:Uncharacterized protein n=1 Tax=Solitalea longa TaxID=2079460 RepID=A0A2S5A2B8_9SPHI|nr:hypothetical protein [Solitalea longa]POY36449.1 hypothetical protein C3K47_11950 [Solitalea longa]